MAALKRKPKAKAKTKVKAKVKAKSKLKAKTKPKPKSKVKAKAKSSKKKVTKKLKSSSKKSPKKSVKKSAKPKSKVVAKSKKAVPAQSKQPKTPKAKVSKINYTEDQKQNLLAIIDKIVNFYKHKKYGLGTLDTIDQILDQYNQHYRSVVEKFDAIAEYGMKKDPAFIPKSVFVFENTHIRHEDELYRLLEDIWDGKVSYAEASDRMNQILAECHAEKQKHF